MPHRHRALLLCHEGHHETPDWAADPMPGAGGGHDHDHGHTHTHQNTKQVLNRLSRIVGHLNAVKTMVEAGRDCSEVLIQLAAVQSALNGFCRTLLASHLHSCVTEDIRAGKDEAVDELMEILKKLMK